MKAKTIVLLGAVVLALSVLVLAACGRQTSHSQGGFASSGQSTSVPEAGASHFDIHLVPANSETVPSALDIENTVAALRPILARYNYGLERYTFIFDADGEGENSDDLILRVFPAEAEDDVGRVFAAMNEVVDQATLTMREGAEVDDEIGLPMGVTARNVVLDNDDIEAAKVLYDQYNGYSPPIQMMLTRRGAEKLVTAADRLTEGSTLSIWAGPEMLVNPTWDAPFDADIIASDGLVLSTPSPREAEVMAEKMNAMTPYRLAIGRIADMGGTDVSGTIAEQVAVWEAAPPVVDPKHVFHDSLTQRQIKLLQQPVTLASLERIVGDTAEPTVIPGAGGKGIGIAKSDKTGLLALFFTDAPANGELPDWRALAEQEILKVMVLGPGEPYVLFGKYDSLAKNQATKTEFADVGSEPDGENLLM